VRRLAACLGIGAGMDTVRFAEIADSKFQVAWKDGERVFYRGRHKDSDDSLVAVLAVQPSSEHPHPAVIYRLRSANMNGRTN